MLLPSPDQAGWMVSKKADVVQFPAQLGTGST